MAIAGTGTTTRVSVASDGAQGDRFTEGGVAVSADGRYVAFRSAVTNLVPDDTNGRWDVFVRDTVNSTTTRVSVASDGTQATGDSFEAKLSADGRYVAFGSAASDLVAGDTNGHHDLFVHDAVEGSTTRVSVASDGTQANGDSFEAKLSADGHYVTFTSFATNLVPGDTNSVRDAFIRDWRAVIEGPPEVSPPLTKPDPAAVGTAVAVTSGADDSATGGSDIANGAYRWRVDGSESWSSWTPMVASDGAFDSPTETLEATIADGFASAGVYEVCVRATDTAGNTSDGTACAFLAVYDPTAGFAVGSGEVHSPASADLVNGAAGPATFAFVSKYAKGKTTPDGGLQFHFRDGDLSFRSTSQAWLVVTGEPRARFKAPAYSMTRRPASSTSTRGTGRTRLAMTRSGCASSTATGTPKPATTSTRSH